MGLFQRKSTNLSEVVSNEEVFEVTGFKKPSARPQVSLSSTAPTNPNANSAPNNLSRHNNTPKFVDGSGNNTDDFGVTDLIRLFHSLPQLNFDAEISAAVRTIASHNVNVQALIEELANQQSLAMKRVKVLELEVELFKAKIKNRRKELDLLQIGISELAKSKDYLQQGLAEVSDRDFLAKQQLQKKKAANLKKKAESDHAIPIADKIRIATHKELEQNNSQGKIKSLRNKFKRHFLKN